MSITIRLIQEEKDLETVAKLAEKICRALIKKFFRRNRWHTCWK